jgi:hypothetical protein
MLKSIKSYFRERRERRLRMWIVKNAHYTDCFMFSEMYKALSAPQKRGERRLRKWLYKEKTYDMIEETLAFIAGCKSKPLQ